MSHNRHSYVPFYPSDWIAGTAGMPRIMWSIYFQICVHNWDKNQPMSESYLRIMTSDLPPEQVGDMLQMMIDTGKIILDEEQGFYSPRALAEADKAFESWKKKSEGGRAGGIAGGGRPKGSKRTPKAMLKDSLRSQKQNQNQNQNQNHDITPQTPQGDLKHSLRDADEQVVQEIAAFEAETDERNRRMAQAVETVANAWNVMASANGLAQMSKMTDGRLKHLRKRIIEHGDGTLVEAIHSIPKYPFLLGKGDNGWKANFDWLIRPDKCAKLVEGGYSERSGGRESGWR